MEQVGIEKPDIQGRGSIRSISMNGLDVTSHHAVSTVGRLIYSLGDLEQVGTHYRLMFLDTCRVGVLSTLLIFPWVGSWLAHISHRRFDWLNRF